ncbi:hypothetical protein VP01_7538g1 [Puccinia sorghi]|uniref:Uncharacterized protein n=1 Tax=Puccinia sorghi TaxID=27349 RepID=A0A0L6UC23_9BASI|nr:hypothetical protein VP01_7538g1 [Puccinia sorghi]
MTPSRPLFLPLGACHLPEKSLWTSRWNKRHVQSKRGGETTKGQEQDSHLFLREAASAHRTIQYRSSLYLVIGPQLRGKFLPEKVRQLSVKPGSDFAKLVIKERVRGRLSGLGRHYSSSPLSSYALW